MNKERFQELCKAIKQAKAVHQGNAAPTRVWEVTQNKNGEIVRRKLEPAKYVERLQKEREKTIAATRKALGLSQSKFADLLGISIKTLHNWEQGRRKPTGAARILLRVAALHPEVILEAAT